MADSVESLIGAHFLSNDSLEDTLRWIDSIKLVPLSAVGQVERFADFKECSFQHLKQINLPLLPFTKEETMHSLLEKYFALP